MNKGNVASKFQELMKGILIRWNGREGEIVGGKGKKRLMFRSMGIYGLCEIGIRCSSI